MQNSYIDAEQVVTRDILPVTALRLARSVALLAALAVAGAVRVEIPTVAVVAVLLENAIAAAGKVT